MSKPRPQKCKTCEKHIGDEPGRSSKCLVCLDKESRARATPLSRVSLSPVTGDINLCCDRCQAAEFFENYFNPIRNATIPIGKINSQTKEAGPVVKPLIDRLNHHLRAFTLAHRRCTKPQPIAVNLEKCTLDRC